MGSFTMRMIMLGVFLITLQAITEEVESVQVRPMYGRPVPPSMAFRMRRDPPARSMHMMGPHGYRSPPSRRQYYSPNYRPLQRPRKSPPPSQYHYGQPPKRTIHTSYATHKSHYAPFPKHEMGSRRPPYKYAPSGNYSPPKYLRPDAMHMKPYPSFPTKTKYSGYQQDYAPVRRPSKNTSAASTVSFPSPISDNVQVIQGTREKPSYHSKPSYNSYISTTEQSDHSDYFAAPVSSSFHAVAPGTSSHQTSSQLAHTSASYGIANQPASDTMTKLQTSSFPNSPSTPHAFAASSGSPAVSFSYIEHGSSGQQQAASSNYAKTLGSTQNFQAPASQSFGFVPYSNNGQTQSTQGLSQVVQFPNSSGGQQRNTRKTQQGGESHILSPNYYDSSATHAVSVSASIPTFESHTSFDQVEAVGKMSSNDDRFTQVSYPSNHRSSYDSST